MPGLQYLHLFRSERIEQFFGDAAAALAVLPGRR